MEALSLPIIVLILVIAIRFNKAIKSVADVVDTKVSAMSAEIKSEVIEDINAIQVDEAKIVDAQAKIKTLNSIKF